MGYLKKWEEGGGKVTLEIDTEPCSHCQRVLPKQTWTLPGQPPIGVAKGQWCSGCGKVICKHCYPIMVQEGCKPFKQKIDQAVDEMYKRRLW
jgi:hypothetical protein